MLVRSYGRLQRHLSRENPTERTPLAPNKTLQYRRRLRITRRFDLWIEIVLGIVRWNTNSLPTACEQEKDGFGRIILSANKCVTDLVAYMKSNFSSWQWLTVLPRIEGVVLGGPGIFMWWVNARACVRVRKCWLERSFINSLHVPTPQQSHEKRKRRAMQKVQVATTWRRIPWQIEWNPWILDCQKEIRSFVWSTENISLLSRL